MITAQHKSLLVETLKSMTPLELSSLLEEVADHFKREKLVPIIKKAFDFHGYEDDVEDLENRLGEAEEEASDMRNALDEVGMICDLAKETDDAETLYGYIQSIQKEI